MGTTRFSKFLSNYYLAPSLAFSAFALSLLGLKLWQIGAYGNATPFWDQWGVEAQLLYKPFLEDSGNWLDLLSPHNEHRMLTSRLLALMLLIVNGIWNPLLQMVVNAILHIVTLGFCIAILTRVIGRKHLPSLLLFALILFGFPYAWENTLLGIGSQFYFVLLFSVAALWLTINHPPLSIYWWNGLGCGVLAFFSVASGVLVFAVSAFIGACFYGLGLRKTNRQVLGVTILLGFFLLGVGFTPTVPHHAALKATSFLQFYEALMAVLSWPMPANIGPTLIRNLPALIFTGIMFCKHPASDDRKWFLFGLVVWVLAQSVISAYARAVFNLSSRYLDFFAINILVNLSCLIALAQDFKYKHSGWVMMSVGLWALTVLIYVGISTHDRTWELIKKHNTGITQEINTRNYVATGDFNYLKNKPLLDIPFPHAESLAAILSSPTIQKILPANIRKPLKHTTNESIPADAFVLNGFPPAAPKRSDLTLGSYSRQGNIATGKALIRFESNAQSDLIAIPVSGYPLSRDMKLEVEQNGQFIPVKLKFNPNESWGVAYVTMGNGDFSIHLADYSKTAWLAIGSPVVMGRFDVFINRLLAHYTAFIMLGFVFSLLTGLLLLKQPLLIQPPSLEKSS
ncbi:MAG: hypothetical protein HOP02_01795 [Methylococcaceae bacterium]|nr:hypothetical protein [Methylococcaceae bacterium]